MKLPDGITLPPLSIAVIKLIKTRQSKYGITVDNWGSLSSGQQQHLKEIGVVHSPNHVPVLTKAGEELINQLQK